MAPCLHVGFQLKIGGKIWFVPRFDLVGVIAVDLCRHQDAQIVQSEADDSNILTGCIY